MKLNAQHQHAIILLSEGQNNKAVAETLNIAPETLSRWKSDYHFQAQLNSLLTANHEAQADKLRRLSGVALDTIEQVMQDNEALHRDKLTAAFKVLELTKLRQSNLGSINPETLQQQQKESELLGKYDF
ncbi:MAG: hypothetical protein QNK15_04610 [Cycloclasticus sp.]|nr:hypothetical protein [Cycloclasticus sp.]